MSAFAARWVFVLDEDFEFAVSAGHSHDDQPSYCFRDSRGQRRLTVHGDGRAVIHRGYAWDGCTPKFQFLDLLLGTPDGVTHTRTQKPKCYYASLVHDALYQFLDCGLPLDRAGADRLFLFFLQRDHFALRWIYYAAVRLFGGLFRAGFTRWKRDYRNQKREIIPPEQDLIPTHLEKHSC